MLGESLTPFPKPPAEAQLVRRGIYAKMRHPIYAGLIALSSGWAYLWGSGRGAALALIQAVVLDINSVWRLACVGPDPRVLDKRSLYRCNRVGVRIPW